MKALPSKYRIKPQRRPQNPAEAQFYDWADSHKWTISKKGWPDFACFLPNGRLVLVEVKPKRSHRLKTWQNAIMQALSTKGVECYSWTPSTGFTKIVAPISTPE